jgi:rod shape-determining protein MreD
VRHGALFGLATFFLGWLLQTSILSVTGAATPTPHWLLLFVLALGAGGRLNLAQTLGFFWGISLDVFGVTLFGAQGWLLALAGHVTARLSRQLNAEKLVTQEALSLAGTFFFTAGVILIENIFRNPPRHSLVTLTGFLLNLALNALAAPVAFWAMAWWERFWLALESGRLKYG